MPKRRIIPSKVATLADLKIERLSPYNLKCVLLQCPRAQYVAGFHDWKSIGRYVRKGEKGIQILAPLMPPKNDPERGVKFRAVYVFELSQTEAYSGGQVAA